MTVKFVPLPRSVHGFVSRAAEPDGDYEMMIINALDPPSVQAQTYEHEMNHSERGHFDDHRPLRIKESEAL